MIAPSNHNGGPPLVERSFKKRWAQALFNYPGKKPMGSVAMSFLIYMRMDGSGEGAAIPDSEFMSHCGVSDGSVRVFKRWLVAHEFIKIKVRGHRGSCSEFKAIIPAAAAAIESAADSEIPATNAGIVQPEYRQPMPVVDNGIPANNAGNRQMAAADAGNPPAVGAQNAGAVVSKYIINNNPLEDTHTPLPPQNQPHEGVCVTPNGPRDGEEAIGHGAFMNCTTVRHRHFMISIEAIAIQLATASGLGLTIEEAREYARSGAKSHAIDWAAQIENGKLSGDVVPKHIANFIRGSVASQLTKASTATRRTSTSSAGSSETGEERKKRLFQEASNELRGRK